MPHPITRVISGPLPKDWTFDLAAALEPHAEPIYRYDPRLLHVSRRQTDDGYYCVYPFIGEAHLLDGNIATIHPLVPVIVSIRKNDPNVIPALATFGTLRKSIARYLTSLIAQVAADHAALNLVATPEEWVYTWYGAIPNTLGKLLQSIEFNHHIPYTSGGLFDATTT